MKETSRNHKTTAGGFMKLKAISKHTVAIIKLLTVIENYR